MTHSNFSQPTDAPQAQKQGLHYNTVWRWHFYAGLLCIPFILWLSCTGLIYLFKPQIDAYIDRPYDHLIIQHAQPASAQVQAAVNAVPHAVFSAYQMPPYPDAAARILVAQQDQLIKVYVHPENLQILKVINQNDEFTRQIFLLHGEFMLGNKGSHLMQIAASWTVVLIITGIFMWLGKGGKLQLGGMLYPRLNRTGRSFWKDLHSVLGFWISAIVLFLIVSGLPWSASWGAMLKNIREWSAHTEIHQDWSSSSKAEAQHQQHVFNHLTKQQKAAHHGEMPAADLDAAQNRTLDKIAVQASTFTLANPVFIKPEIQDMQQPWTVESQAQNRSLREKIIFNAHAQITQHKKFADQAFLDRLIAYGVAIHEGRFLGWINVVIGVVTLFCLILVSISGLMMWLKRKPQAVLGAPPIILSQRLSWSLKLTMIILGIALPLLGLSLIVVLCLEQFILSRIPKIALYLGLKDQNT